jgi:hypothetical protein
VHQKPRTLLYPRHKVETALVAIQPATMREACQPVARYYHQSIGAGGGNFSYICKFEVQDEK